MISFIVFSNESSKKKAPTKKEKVSDTKKKL
jgi:hypothetical protein